MVGDVLLTQPGRFDGYSKCGSSEYSDEFTANPNSLVV